MLDPQTCVSCGKESNSTERCRNCGRPLCTTFACNNGGCCRDKDSCLAAQRYESEKRVKKQKRCGECGGDVVTAEDKDVCMRCHPEDSHRMVRRRSSRTAPPTKAAMPRHSMTRLAKLMGRDARRGGAPR